MKHLFLLLLCIFCLFVSCKKKSTNDNNTSRVVKYEISGNFSGTLFASYTTASGGTANEQVTSLPWSKEITYASNVSAAIIAFSGNGGTAGQQVTIVVKKGGTQVSSTPVTAGSSGSFSQAAPVVTF
jgi:hypothetical protein